ncbi:MAG: hypothetical protein WBC91_17435, partial [Phototrophicaceae bacterium]
MPCPCVYLVDVQVKVVGMPIYEALRGFASVAISPRKGQVFSTDKANGDSLVKAGYAKFLEDDPVSFDDWGLDEIKAANLNGDDGLLAYADYAKIPLGDATKK